MKTLMIDILNNSKISNIDVKNIEEFFISFGLITQNADTMTTDLANRAFTHSIEMISDFTTNVNTEISLVDPNSNPFAYIAIERYTTNEFYDIMIDTNASNRFTIDYEQFLTYSKDSQTSINTENVEVIHVQFEIDSISFIKSVNVITLIESIEFHVVKIDTPFLLCLTEMNRLKIYYNNIKNIFISNNMLMSISVIRRFDHSFLL